MTSDNTPPPLQGELGVAGSPLGELPTHRLDLNKTIALNALAYAGRGSTLNEGIQS